ncbi:MAG: Ig-like domain-containing protein [Candidatus Pseudobacter hemicellulosilyticus]|uniref:Ig-like domain-containing protein n=1 Tax=Candidatus Pseudobacter hemicellulosilyticus TaxID=3121375 RepID=A0AAJ6BGY6_9BACT|nr:MAG: Ig-like domain-containing protein [Pseudobacter sp.]
MVKIKSLLFVLLIGSLVAGNMISSTGCANMGQPTGGPKDSLPPRMVTVKPLDSTRNFTGNKIVFEFDEFVQIDNVQENLLVSPTPKINPIVTGKLRTVTVTIKDTLEENTTYSIDFGKAIKDVNEGNALRNFRYIYSTGPQLDSLGFSGKVIIAENGKTDSTLIVLLHSSQDDSAMIKDRPRYVARLDSSGNFQFRNLPPGIFSIYALKDEGGQRKYMSKTQLFAFADSTINTQEPRNITLYAYLEKDTVPVKKPSTGAGRQGNKPPAPESRKFRIETNTSNGQFDLLDTLSFQFRTAPLRFFDSTRLQFTDEKYKPLTGYRFIRDTSNTKVSLIYSWTPNTAYNIILDTLFAEDTLGLRLPKTDTLAFRTKKESEYGLVRLRFINLDLAQHPVLQFIQSEKVVYSHVFTSRDFNARLFKPGEYELRILLDRNRNGIWDPGDFFGTKIQPEKVMPVPRKVNIKANWDNEIDITL